MPAIFAVAVIGSVVVVGVGVVQYSGRTRSRGRPSPVLATTDTSCHLRS